MDIEIARINMLKQQIRTSGVLNEKILAVFEQMPREDFVPHEYRNMAYADTMIPLPHEQCMLSPQLEAQIMQQVAVQHHDQVLEIGTGMGYLTGVIAHLAHHVTSVDIFAKFTELATHKLAKLMLNNISLHTGNAALGWGSQLYDVIIVSAALPFVPQSLLAQLAPGGRLFAVIGTTPAMEACLIKRDATGALTSDRLFETVVPPMIDALHHESFIF